MVARRYLITGIANERSLAAAVARELAGPDTELVLSYQDERLRPRVEAVAADLASAVELVRLDVSDAEVLAAVCAGIAARPLHGLLHAIAFGRLTDAAGGPLPVHAVDDARFGEALRISAHSLARLADALLPGFAEGAGIVALTYLGARRVRRGYNLMGVAKAALEAEVRYLAAELGARQVRVNAVSAGPVRTAATRGVPGFAARLAEHAEHAALGRNVSAAEVGRAAAFLLSPAASGISGQILTVDAGYDIF